MMNTRLLINCSFIDYNERLEKEQTINIFIPTEIYYLPKDHRKLNVEKFKRLSTDGMRIKPKLDEKYITGGHK